MDALTPTSTAVRRPSGTPIARRFIPALSPVILVSLFAVAAASCGGTSPSTEGSTLQLRTLARDAAALESGAASLAPQQSLARESTRDLRVVVVGPEPTSGLVMPYSTENVIGTFGDCRGRRTHRGLDLAGVGDDAGLGDPIVSMARAKVTLIGTPEIDRKKFGRRDTRSGTTERGNQMLPRQIEVEGYGTVYPFTRRSGSWDTGVIIVTSVIDGPLAGHRVRYMHLAAVRPDLEEGDIVAAGEEIGLMGGTAVQWSPPHVHIDIEDENGRRIDPAPLLGLEGDNSRCRKKKRRRR